MKVFLHIGAPRTGTTTLQALLTKNRLRLTDIGIDYPAVALLDPKKGLAQHKLAFSLLPKWPAFALQAKVTPDATWGELRDYMQGADKPIFLSSETFSSLGPEGVEYVARFFAGHDVTAIFVRRDPDEWRRSMREHLIVMGTRVPKAPTRPAKEFMAPIVNRWKQRFSVTVIDYGPDCLQKVLSIAGVDQKDLEPVENRNTKVPPDVLDLLSRLNRLPISEQIRHRINRTILDWRRGRERL